MASYVFLAIAPLIILSFVIFQRILAVRKGVVSISADYDGIRVAEARFDELLAILSEKLVQYRKLFVQYLLHSLVRFLAWWKDATQSLYAVSRNHFLKTAVKNKDAIPLFWEHLKEYKAQIEKEREMSNNKQ